MIIGIGYDIVEVGRIKRILERRGEQFASRVLHEEERRDFAARFRDAFASPNAPAFFASRFAAKEAAVKALGTGFQQGIAPQHVYVIPDDLGKPLLRFSGPAADAAERTGVTAAFLSLTHERSLAGAMVVLEGYPV